MWMEADMMITMMLWDIVMARDDRERVDAKERERDGNDEYVILILSLSTLTF